MTVMMLARMSSAKFVKRPEGRAATLKVEPETDKKAKWNPRNRCRAQKAQRGQDQECIVNKARCSIEARG
jgi:hypothetical protein